MTETAEIIPATKFPFTLSLYAIVSRECASKYVARALESFQAIKPDEIVLCSAMGKNTEEGLPILQEVGKKFGAKVISYENAPRNADWDHLDSFCNARNKALEACSSDWAMWFDCDDLLIAGAEKALWEITARAKPSTDCFFCGYQVPLAGLIPVRERLSRKGKMHWVYPVHEQLKPLAQAGLQAMGTHQPLVIHAPIGHKTASITRNHAILDHALFGSELYCYYKADEFFQSGKYEDAVKWARITLLREEIDVQMRAQCHIMIGRCLTDPVLKRRELLEAYALMPHRAEALFYLAENYYNLRHFPDALALARSACAVPKPNVTYWTQKNLIYDWEAPDLYLRSARATGNKELIQFLDDDRQKNFGEYDITLCHATARPDVAKMARWNFMSQASQPNKIQHIFGIDEQTAKLDGYDYIVSGKTSCVGAWNACARNAKGKYIVQMSDDWIPPYGWDEEIRTRLPDTNAPAVLAVNDGYRKDDLLCMAICTKATLELLGGNLFAPEYAECSGIFSDNEFTKRTKHIQVPAPDLTFRHLNPFFTQAPQDQIFIDHNSAKNYQIGKRIFEERNP